MTPETTVLLLIPVLGMIYFVGAGSLPRIIEQGLIANFYGARDNLPALKGVYAQRLERANNNFRETVPYAISLLLLVQILGVANEMSALGAWIYLWARVAYFLIYVSGIPLIRSGVWMISIIGLIMVALPILSVG